VRDSGTVIECRSRTNITSPTDAASARSRSAAACPLSCGGDGVRPWRDAGKVRACSFAPRLRPERPRPARASPPATPPSSKPSSKLRSTIDGALTAALVMTHQPSRPRELRQLRQPYRAFMAAASLPPRAPSPQRACPALRSWRSLAWASMGVFNRIGRASGRRTRIDSRGARTRGTLAGCRFQPLQHRDHLLRILVLAQQAIESLREQHAQVRILRVERPVERI
jgi:hypothetical protein